ncbi:MAG TPA: CRISPR-associated helicase Cas3', partial [Fimbriimonadales bacterium]|nr:CRISPR-associated helicase Cas3' [Fimbriimonadales bacterium]
GSALSLEQHLIDTENAASLLFIDGTRWGEAFPRFFKVASGEIDNFRTHLRLSALFHDIGKANADFVNAMWAPQFKSQTMRHEHISALLIYLPAVRDWLSQNPDLHVDIIASAVLCHHIKAGEGEWMIHQNQAVVAGYFDHPEVLATLDRIGEVASLSGRPPIPTGAVSTQREPWATAFRDGCRALRRFGRTLRDPRWAALHAATKSGLIIADAVASGIVRTGGSIEKWIEEVAHREALTAEYIAEEIIAKRGQAIERNSGKPFKLGRFQEMTAEQGSRALLLAACGAGKTLAAWKWAESVARTRAIGSVVFLYPTRGTATEGFRDYVAWAPESEAALVHATAKTDLVDMAENPSEAMQGKDFSPGEAGERLFALGLWSRRLFSATVDQFLSFLSNRYSSLCLLPLLADSAVIVDEVHSYDRRMLDELLCFLKRFDVPVLCMTATLPAKRRQALADAGLSVFPNEHHREDLAELEDKECHPRYRFDRSDRDAALMQAIDAYRERGQRVLVVVNQVGRCQAFADELADRLGEDTLCYHSRYKLVDRRNTHERTVEAFKQRDRPAIAVATQVCEMSLDLDADLLITEHAPVTAMVQRAGRVNRHLEGKPDGFVGRIVTIPPSDFAPYSQADLEAAAKFLAAVSGRTISQRDLAQALEAHSPPEADPLAYARFFAERAYATPGDFRDTQQLGYPCILDSDVDDYVAACKRRELTDNFVVNVPAKTRPGPPDEHRPPELSRWLGIAPASQYSTTRGFMGRIS